METKARHDTSDLIHLSYFTDLGKAIVRSNTIRELLGSVMEHVGSVFAPRNWSLLLVDSRKKELVFSLVIGKASETLKGMRIPIDEGVAGWIVRTGQSVIVEDVNKDPRFNSTIDRVTNFKTESIIGVPLKSKNRIFGVIELINKIDGEPFTPFDLQVLSTLADFTAIAIEKIFYINTMKKISREDYLTGSLNRRSMDIILQREVERCRRYKTNLSVLLVDIDDFKGINDSHGHLEGDEVLCCCARILKDCVRKIDYIIRYGGDEFAVIMPDTARESAEKARKRIYDAVERNTREGKGIPFSVSIGLHSSASSSLTELLHLSDQDLYKEKEAKEPLRVDEHMHEFLREEEIEDKAGKEERTGDNT